ncbi:uracil-DNA glycosylase family protein [Streptococcus sp. 121]|uniref:uracil-DNA glycosylase family protein n=1 Tax=Streptococcus sp. 121 TaxID=2797637 RepID=UPI0018F088E0|nr:uracil-DNA glycosylase family protein [Streptococcus sp. 121]MBJ6744870.1 uracil-DNA glycosylase family protein [Streptococcus sp. 121]
MMKNQVLVRQIMDDAMNHEYTKQGIAPLFQVPASAKIVLIGQAPGIRAQEIQTLFHDPSGDRLRQWMGVDTDWFYNSGQLAILPMDFYFPGKGKSGDLPPRKGFAEKWHPLCLKHLKEVELTILMGTYAQKCYLGGQDGASLTETVRNYSDYLPSFFPIIHPSPRNNIWLKKHPWFEAEVIPDLQKRIREIIACHQ